MPGGRGRRRRQVVDPEDGTPPFGRGMGQRRGRHRSLRRVAALPPVKSFIPDDAEFAGRDDPVILTVEEYEALRLVDFVGLQQEAASVHMGISRRALWQDLQSARFKIAQALSSGRTIVIEGGDFSLTGDGN